MIYYIGMDFHMNSIDMQNYVKEDLSHKEYIYIYITIIGRLKKESGQ